MGFKLTTGAIILAAVVIGAGIIGVAGFEDVPAEHKSVVTYKGNPDTVAHPGTWYWFNPATHKAHEIDMRPQLMEMNQGGKGDDAINLQTNNEMRVPMDVAITYRVTNAKEFFKTWKSHEQARERLIRPVVRQRAYTEGGAMNTSELPTKEGRLKLTDAIYGGLEDEFESQPVEVLSVEIRGFHPPKPYMDAIESKNIEAQRVQAAEQRAEQQRVDAQGAADAARIEAEGDADATLARAEAEAKANDKLDESLSDDVLTYRHIEGLDRGDTIYMPIGDDGLPIIVSQDHRQDDTANETDSDDENDAMVPIEVAP